MNDESDDESEEQEQDQININKTQNMSYNSNNHLNLNKSNNIVKKQTPHQVNTNKMWASCLAVDYGKNVVLKFGVDKSMKVYSVENGKFNLKNQ